MTVDSAGHVRTGTLAGGARDAVLAPERTAALARLVDASRLWCAAETPRAELRPALAERVTIELSTTGGRRRLTIDPCFTVSDPTAFAAVEAALAALAPPLAAAAGAGPAASTLAGACDDARLAGSAELDRRERRLEATLAGPPR